MIHLRLGIAAAGLQRLGSGGRYHLDSVIAGTEENVHHLLAAILATIQALPHGCQRCRQMPGPERGTVADRPGLALQYGDVVADVIDRPASPELADVAADDLAAETDLDVIG